MSFHYAREAFAKGQADIQYVESAKNKADIMTKPWAKQLFQVRQSIRLPSSTLSCGQGEVLNY